MKKLLILFLLSITSIHCSDEDQTMQPQTATELIGEWRFVNFFSLTQSSRCWECPDFKYNSAYPKLTINAKDEIVSIDYRVNSSPGFFLANRTSKTSKNIGGLVSISFLNPLITSNLSNEEKTITEELEKVKEFNLPLHASTNNFDFLELTSNSYVLIFAKQK